MTHPYGPGGNQSGPPRSHPGPGLPGYGSAPPPYPAGPWNAGPQGATDPADMTLPLYGAPFGAGVARYFRGYVRFRGRASQSEYWWAQLFQVVVGVVLVVVLMVAVMPPLMDLPDSQIQRLSGDQAALAEWVFDTSSVAGVAIVVLVISLALMLGNLALGWRRLQDANVHGGWTFVSLLCQALTYVPVVGAFVSVGSLAWWVVVGTLSTKPEGERFDRPRLRG